MPVGYSGTPLPRKLGIKESTQVALVGAPPDYAALLGELPAGVILGTRVSSSTDILHVFVTDRETLAALLVKARQKLRDDAAVWVSWPKKASQVATTVTEDVIRELA